MYVWCVCIYAMVCYVVYAYMCVKCVCMSAMLCCVMLRYVLCMYVWHVFLSARVRDVSYVFHVILCMRV